MEVGKRVYKNGTPGVEAINERGEAVAVLRVNDKDYRNGEYTDDEAFRLCEALVKICVK